MDFRIKGAQIGISASDLYVYGVLKSRRPECPRSDDTALRLAFGMAQLLDIIFMALQLVTELPAIFMYY